MCIGALFLENLLAIPGFIFLIAGLLLWNPGGIMENLYPPLRQLIAIATKFLKLSVSVGFTPQVEQIQNCRKEQSEFWNLKTRNDEKTYLGFLIRPSVYKVYKIAPRILSNFYDKIYRRMSVYLSEHPLKSNRGTDFACVANLGNYLDNLAHGLRQYQNPVAQPIPQPFPTQILPSLPVQHQNNTVDVQVARDQFHEVMPTTLQNCYLPNCSRRFDFSATNSKCHFFQNLYLGVGSGFF